LAKIKLILVLFIILLSDLCVTIPARSLDVGMAKCNQPLDRSGIYNTRPLLKATLASSLEGYDLKFADRFGEHLLKLKRNLIVDSARTLGSDGGEWQLISYKAQPSPVKIQPNGRFRIEMWVSTRSMCLFDGNLQFLGDTKAKLFNMNKSGSSSIISQKNTYSNKACESTLSKVRNQIEESKSNVVNIDRYEHRYTDYPSNRHLAYSFWLTGSGVSNIINSPVFLTALSTDIFSNCNTVGIVKFGFYQSENVVTYGFMKNGSVKKFKCIDANRNRQTDPWGYVSCV
jgi:hypothetical protein